MNGMTKYISKSRTGKSAKRVGHKPEGLTSSGKMRAFNEFSLRDVGMAQGSAIVRAPAKGQWQRVASTGRTTVVKQKPGTFSKLIDHLSRAAIKSHRPQYLMVTPEGDVMVAKDAIAAADHPVTAGRIITRTPEAAAALEDALERGRLTAADILAGKDMLTADELKKAIPVSKTTFHNWRKNGKLLALPHPNGSFRFPIWQFDTGLQPFPAIQHLNERFSSAAGPAPWAVYRFLMQPHPALGGITGLEALKRKRDRDVLDLVDSIQHGDFT